MPSPEEGGYLGQPGEPNKEREPGPYYMASRFDEEQSSKLAHVKAQKLIFANERADLSAYRFQLGQINHVAVVGEPPPDDLQLQMQDISAIGEATELPPLIVKALHERRAQMKKKGSWVEGHYRLGKKLDY